MTIILKSRQLAGSGDALLPQLLLVLRPGCVNFVEDFLVVDSGVLEEQAVIHEFS